MPTRFAKQASSHLARLCVFVLAVLALSGAAARAAGADAAKPPDPLIGLQAGASRTAFDPALSWNTFLGGSGDDGANAAAVDAEGNLYVVGDSSAAWGSPVRGYTNASDGFVAKLSPAGTLVWSTLLGGSGSDSGEGIALDRNGNVYVVGRSDATWGSPLREFSGVTDGFVAKLSPSGELIWNTFLGGSGYDYDVGVAVDGDGNVYVAGSSDTAWQGTDPPVRPYSGEYDIFAAKLDSDGVLAWNTFLGGNGQDLGRAIVVDKSANAYVAGLSIGGSYGVVHAPLPMDYFVVKLGTTGLLAQTYGAGGNALAIDGNGYLYSAGNITNYPYADNAFANKQSPSGTLLWDITFGEQRGPDDGKGVAVDGNGDVYVSGQSNASWGSPVRPFAGNYDGYLLKLNSNGESLWNTFLGGTGYDSASAVAVDANGIVYVVGNSDATWGSPIRPYAGGGDAFVARMNAISRVYLPLGAQ